MDAHWWSLIYCTCSPNHFWRYRRYLCGICYLFLNSLGRKGILRRYCQEENQSHNSRLVLLLHASVWNHFLGKYLCLCRLDREGMVNKQILISRRNRKCTSRFPCSLLYGWRTPLGNHRDYSLRVGRICIWHDCYTSFSDRQGRRHRHCRWLKNLNLCFNRRLSLSW